MNPKSNIAGSLTMLVTPFSESYFTSSKQRNTTTFVCEASTLMDKETGRSLHLERLERDSCAHGFAVKFGKTGPVIKYYLVRINYSTECPGDLASWHYFPTAESVKQHPSYKNTRALVLND